MATALALIQIKTQGGRRRILPLTPFTPKWRQPMIHIRNMVLMMFVAPPTALVCWAIWTYIL